MQSAADGEEADDNPSADKDSKANQDEEFLLNQSDVDAADDSNDSDGDDDVHVTKVDSIEDF